MQIPNNLKKDKFGKKWREDGEKKAQNRIILNRIPLYC